MTLTLWQSKVKVKHEVGGLVSPAEHDFTVVPTVTQSQYEIGRLGYY